MIPASAVSFSYSISVLACQPSRFLLKATAATVTTSFFYPAEFPCPLSLMDKSHGTASDSSIVPGFWYLSCPLEVASSIPSSCFFLQMEYAVGSKKTTAGEFRECCTRASRYNLNREEPRDHGPSRKLEA